MSSLVPGTAVNNYNRIYIVVNPNPPYGPFGPNTLNITAPEQISGGGGGPGTSYEFDGIAPINVDTILGTGNDPDNIQTSLDISQLDDRSL